MTRLRDAKVFGEPAALRAVLSEATTMPQLNQIAEHLRSTNPDDRVGQAIKAVLHEPGAMDRLLVFPTDYAVASKFLSVEGDTFALLYKAAMKADTDHRREFLAACLTHATCGRDLLPAIEADHGALFKGMRDLRAVSAALHLQVRNRSGAT